MPISLLVHAFAVLTALASSAAAFDLSGARLGMPLNEFRRLQLSEMPGAKVVCRGDAEAHHLRPTQAMKPSEAEEKLGVVSCGFYRFGKVLGESTAVLPPEWVSAPVRIAGVPSAPVFWFVAEPASGGEPRLFRISVSVNSVNWDKYWTDFTRRHGRPTFEKRERYSTGPHGGHLDNIIGIWDDGGSSLTLTKHGKRASQMSVQYLDKRAVWAIQTDPG